MSTVLYLYCTVLCTVLYFVLMCAGKCATLPGSVLATVTCNGVGDETCIPQRSLAGGICPKGRPVASRRRCVFAKCALARIPLHQRWRSSSGNPGRRADFLQLQSRAMAEICTICLMPLISDVATLTCGHALHLECVRQLRSKGVTQTCPNCRQQTEEHRASHAWGQAHIANFCKTVYCTVLYCTVLYCTVLYCTVLILYCTVLYCTFFCTVLYLYCTVVLYSTVLYCTCTVLYWNTCKHTTLRIKASVVGIQG